MKKSKNALFWITFLTVLAIFYAVTFSCIPGAHAKPPTKSKFYDFNEQVIDGQIRRPTALYTSARERAKFERLLKLKKSFLPKLFQTSKEKVFK